jgi:RNA-directed DNA polymerase
VLEPIVEINSDKHSYGFRKFRSAKMALGAVRVNLRSDSQMYDKYVLDADVKEFFDNISHTWLIENIPLERTLKPLLAS